MKKEEMHDEIFKLKSMKNEYAILDKEIRRLSQFNASTDAGARKVQRANELKLVLENVKNEYKKIYKDMEEWLDDFPSDYKTDANVLKAHYAKIEIPEKDLNKSIEKCGSYDEKSNFRARVYRLWLESVK